jgi:hypothetical protein
MARRAIRRRSAGLAGGVCPSFFFHLAWFGGWLRGAILLRSGRAPCDVRWSGWRVLFLGCPGVLSSLWPCLSVVSSLIPSAAKAAFVCGTTEVVP